MTVDGRNEPDLISITDSHAHYDCEAFDSDRDEVITSLFDRGIERIINVGCSVKSTFTSMALAEKYKDIYFAAGIHPDAADDINDGGSFAERLATVRKAAMHNKCVAIGEIGADYHFDDGFDRETQLYAFEQQLILANELQLPVIIHSRDSCEDTMALLRKYHPRGVLHCFSGSAETAAEVVSMGMYVGFTGVISFKNAKKAKRAAAAVPMDRLLIETDCPYMSPEPHRGERNDSGNLIYTAVALAQIKDTAPEEIKRITSDNALRLFDKLTVK